MVPPADLQVQSLKKGGCRKRRFQRCPGHSLSICAWESHLKRLASTYVVLYRFWCVGFRSR